MTTHNVLEHRVMAVPSVSHACVAVTASSCSFPLTTFDPFTSYRFRVVTLQDGVVRAVSDMSSPSNFAPEAGAVSVGAIVGIVVGGTLVVVLVVVGVYLLHRKWTSGKFHRALDAEDSAHMYYKF